MITLIKNSDLWYQFGAFRPTGGENLQPGTLVVTT